MKGKGNYTGTKTITFKIWPPYISSFDFSYDKKFNYNKKINQKTLRILKAGFLCRFFKKCYFITKYHHLRDGFSLI